MYTVEIYKKDLRTKKGERLVLKKDYALTDRQVLTRLLEVVHPSDSGYRYEIHETWVTRKNLMGGSEFRERYDTPYYCSPSSETYWSM